MFHLTNVLKKKILRESFKTSWNTFLRKSYHAEIASLHKAEKVSKVEKIEGQG